jgi:hypothetical protein
VVPFLLWIKWWEAAIVIGFTLLSAPAVYWRQNRKDAQELAAKGLPWADAPGKMRIAEPSAGSLKDTIVGRIVRNSSGRIEATGACCEKPDWIGNCSVNEKVRVPCSACKVGVMVASEFAIS